MISRRARTRTLRAPTQPLLHGWQDLRPDFPGMSVARSLKCRSGSMSEPNEALTTVGAARVHTLHHQLVRRAVTHFFPTATLTIGGPEAARFQRAPAGAQHVQFACAGLQCECRRAHPFS